MKIHLKFEVTDSSDEFGELSDILGFVFGQARPKIVRQASRRPALCQHPEADDVLRDEFGQPIGTIEVTRDR